MSSEASGDRKASRKESRKKSEAGVKNMSKSSKKKEEIKKQKEVEAKEKVIKEERIRLQAEANKRMGEMDKLRLFLNETIKQKEIETEQLNEELELNKNEYTNQYNNINEQLEYLDANETQIKEFLHKSYLETYETMIKNQQLKRKVLADKQEEMKENKLLEFDVKRKELDWLLQLYGDSEELDKVNKQKVELEIEIQQWLTRYEIQCGEEEGELDEFEAVEDNRLERNFKSLGKI